MFSSNTDRMQKPAACCAVATALCSVVNMSVHTYAREQTQCTQEHFYIILFSQSTLFITGHSNGLYEDKKYFCETKFGSHSKTQSLKACNSPPIS